MTLLQEAHLAEPNNHLLTLDYAALKIKLGLLVVFDLLENQGDLVNQYRRKLFTLLH